MEAALSKYLEAHLPAANVRISNLFRIPGGASREIVILALEHDQLNLLARALCGGLHHLALRGVDDRVDFAMDQQQGRG